jgi:hypothetical protein
MGWKLRPQKEAKAPDTLNPIGMVNTEGSPWCFPCEEPHMEYKCSRQREEKNILALWIGLNSLIHFSLSRMMNTLISQKNKLKRSRSRELDEFVWKY